MVLGWIIRWEQGCETKHRSRAYLAAIFPPPLLLLKTSIPKLAYLLFPLPRNFVVVTTPPVNDANINSSRSTKKILERRMWQHFLPALLSRSSPGKRIALHRKSTINYNSERSSYYQLILIEVIISISVSLYVD